MKGRYQEFLDRGDKLDDALKSGGPPPKLRARPLDPKDEQYLERELMYQQRMYAADEELANAMPGEGAKAVRNYVGALSSLRGDRSAFNRGMADFMDIFTRGILYSDSAAEIQRVLGEKKYREFAKRARAMRNTREELKNQDIWEKEPDRAAEMYRAYFRGQDSFLEDLVKETQPLMKRYQKAILP
jgi:hypothetical protein